MTWGHDYLARFRCGSYDHILAFATQSPRIADLARTHPILFVALATDYGYPPTRAAAINAALAGRRLRDVCNLANIPLCLRSVPIGLCPVPLPPAYWSAGASPVLAQFIPDDPIALSNWVHAIFFANGAADEPFAMWLAVHHELFVETFLDHRRLLPIALYFWFAGHPEHELHRFVPARWSARAGTRRLMNATRAWLYRICCRAYLPASESVERQTLPVAIGPFLAIELTDCLSLLAEQQAMDNCLDRYARRIASGSFAIFSLRTHTGERVANFEVAIHVPDGPLVTEIKGPSNADVPAEIYDPVIRWVASASEILHRPVEPMKRMIDAEEAFADLIAPYVMSHQKALAHCEPITLRSLEEDLVVLSKRLGMDGWPVRYERTPLA